MLCPASRQYEHRASTAQPGPPSPPPPRPPLPRLPLPLGRRHARLPLPPPHPLAHNADHTSPILHAGAPMRLLWDPLLSTLYESAPLVVGVLIMTASGSIYLTPAYSVRRSHEVRETGTHRPPRPPCAPRPTRPTRPNARHVLPRPPRSATPAALTVSRHARQTPPERAADRARFQQHGNRRRVDGSERWYMACGAPRLLF